MAGIPDRARPLYAECIGYDLPIGSPGSRAQRLAPASNTNSLHGAVIFLVVMLEPVLAVVIKWVTHDGMIVIRVLPVVFDQ